MKKVSLQKVVEVLCWLGIVCFSFMSSFLAEANAYLEGQMIGGVDMGCFENAYAGCCANLGGTYIPDGDANSSGTCRNGRGATDCAIRYAANHCVELQ